MEISSSPRGNLILELSQCAPRWLKCHFHPPQSAPPPLHRSIFNHHPLQPTWLFLFRFLISLQIWAAIPHLARGCVLCSTISPFLFFCPFIFLPHQSFLLFFLRLLLPQKEETSSFHISGQIFPSPTKLSYTMMFSSHIVPFLTHCHFDFPLRRGSTTMWAGKMELWPWPWTMERGKLCL